MDLLFWPCFPVSGPEKLGKLGKLLDGSWGWIPQATSVLAVLHTQDVFKQPGQSPNPER